MRLVDEDDVISLLANHHFDDDKENFDLLIHNLCKEVQQIPIDTPKEVQNLFKPLEMKYVDVAKPIEKIVQKEE